MVDAKLMQKPRFTLNFSRRDIVVRGNDQGNDLDTPSLIINQ